MARSEPGRPSRRRLVLGAVLAVILVLALVGGTWWVARMTESPAQRDAAAAAPSAAPVTATVTVGDLRDEITAQGTIVSAQTTTVSLTLRDEARSVVTSSANVQAGQTVSPGQALMRVNGRPVILLPGAFPTYRDLVQGDQGDDVAQLQQALAALGYGVSADGDFGPATAAALTALYRDLGSTVATISAEAPATAQAAGTNDNQSGDGAAGSTSTSADTGSNADSNAGSGKRTTTAQTLVTLPQSEVVFVPSLEAGTRIVSVPGVGTVLTEENAKITLSSGTPPHRGGGTRFRCRRAGHQHHRHRPD